MKRAMLGAALAGALVLSGLATAQAKRRPALSPQSPSAQLDEDAAAAALARLTPHEWRQVRRWIAACLDERPRDAPPLPPMEITLRIGSDRLLGLLPASVGDSRPPGAAKMAPARLEAALAECGAPALYAPPGPDPLDLLMRINPVTGESQPVRRLP